MSAARPGLARITLDFAGPGTEWIGLAGENGAAVAFLAEGVRRHDDGSLAGLTLTFRADSVPALGYRTYWVTAAARGRGTAVRAAVALSRWALDDLGLHRLDLQHAVANTGSCRVADKAGYAYEATLRSSVLHADGWHDMHVHARIAGDAQVTSTTARSEDKKPRLLNLDLVPGQATRSRRGRCGAPAQHRPVRAGTARGPGRDGLTLREMSALARLDRAARPHRAS